MFQQMDLVECPVCYLALRPDITLEDHLDTHPKEKIVEAFMNYLSFSSSAGTSNYVEQSFVTRPQSTHTLIPATNTNIQPANQVVFTTTTTTTGFPSAGSVVKRSANPLLALCGDQVPVDESNYFQKSLPNSCQAGCIECDNGDFIVYEPPKLVVELEESENGEVRMNERLVVTPLTVLQCSMDEEKTESPADAVKVQQPLPIEKSLTKDSPKILSVAVLGPSDSIDVKQLNCNASFEQKLNVNGYLPAETQKPTEEPQRPKAVATSVIRSVIQENPFKSPKPGSSKGAATSVPKSSPTSPAVDNRDHKEAAAGPSKATGESSKSVGNKSRTASTGAAASAPFVPNVRAKDARVYRAPKILKVTFKKPPTIENKAAEPQPSSSKAPDGLCLPGASESAIEVQVIKREDVAEGESLEPSDSDAMKEVLGINKATIDPSITTEGVSTAVAAGDNEESVRNNDNNAAADEMTTEVSVIEDAIKSLIEVLGEEKQQQQQSQQETEDEQQQQPQLLLLPERKEEDVDKKIELNTFTSDNSACSSSSAPSLASSLTMIGIDLDGHSNVNIRTDEQMPAKGEISEQESNADSEMLWPDNQSFESSRILPSYETSVARESWNFGNANSTDLFSFNCIPKITGLIPNTTTIKLESYKFSSSPSASTSPVPGTSMIIVDDNLMLPGTSGMAIEMMPSTSSQCIVEPSTSSGLNPVMQTARKRNEYACPGCPAKFRLYRERKQHMIDVHYELLSRSQMYNYLRARKENEKLDYLSDEVSTVIADRLAQQQPEDMIGSLVMAGPSKDTATTLNANSMGSSTAGTASNAIGNGISITNLKRALSLGSDRLALIKAERLSIIKLHRFLFEFNFKVLYNKCTTEPRLKQLIVDFRQNRIYFCSQCMEQFKTMRAYKKHMSVHPEKCHTCNEEFWQGGKFIEHMKVHMGLQNLYPCNKCGKTFTLKGRLAIHEASHARKMFKCRYCKQTFNEYYRLQEHKQRIHSNRLAKKDFLCHCGEVFHTAAKYAWHQETHDKSPKGCPYCRERFIHKNSLSRHVRLAHADKYEEFKSNTLPCPVCDKRYIRTSLKVHLLSHTKRPEFQCTICNKVFSTKWNLKMHRWTHNSRSQMPFKCTVCPKAFVRSSDLQMHVNTHKAIRPFTCDHCGCQFGRKYNWLRHTREHEAEKKYTCQVCGKSFHRAYYLKEHSRSHTNERPFECAICGKTSTTKTNHNKHLKIHHARDVTATEG